VDALRLHREPDLGEALPPVAPEWYEDAACADMDTEAFFNETAKGVAEAKATCAGCPVLEACRAEAMADHSLAGVWGGWTEHERGEVRAGREPVDRPRRSVAQARPERPRGELQPCGTPAAYTRHRRRGEPACEACREANRRKVRERRQGRQAAA
jgi:WhiB family transcriptional regulator, redox-sensing transcriptional regulator